MQALIAHLEQGRQRFLSSLEEVDEAGAQFRVQDGTWTILEVAEHVAVAERQMLSLYTKYGKPGASPREKDAALLSALGNREKKNPAPDPSMPKGRFTSLKEAREAFVNYREATMAVLNGPSEDMRAKVYEHPLAGVVDGYQLFLVLGSHPLRHSYQVEEIKIHPAFPRVHK